MRFQLLKGKEVKNISKFSKSNQIVIISYDILLQNIEHIKNKWCRIICNECQWVKNPLRKRFQALIKLKLKEGGSIILVSGKEIEIC